MCGLMVTLPFPNKGLQLERRREILRGGTIARRRAVRRAMYICTSDPSVQYYTLGVARHVQQLHLERPRLAPRRARQPPYRS